MDDYCLVEFGLVRGVCWLVGVGTVPDKGGGGERGVTARGHGGELEGGERGDG